MTSSGPGEPSAEEALRRLERLERRLDEASAAAERLLADAAERVASAGDGAREAGEGARRPPPAGWQAAGPASASREEGWISAGDLDLLLGLLGAVRDRIPPELQQRLTDAVREVLVALRALIDWYLERGGRGRSGPAEVEDIPIL